MLLLRLVAVAAGPSKRARHDSGVENFD